MPNWCYSRVTVNTKSKSDAQNLCNLFNTWLDKGKDESDFKEDWLGSIIKYSGIGNPDTEGCPRCRGRIESLEADGTMLQFTTETAWSPMLKGLQMVIDKYAPGSEITYLSEECGMEIYFTNDPDLIGKIYVDNWTDEQDYIETCNDYEESIVRDKLKKALPLMDVENMSFDDINSALNEANIDIRVHRWKNVPIDELE